MNNLFIVTLSLCTFSLISCESNCPNFHTCGGCIGYAYDRCVWCSAKNYTGRRCQSKVTLSGDETWCSEAIYDPQIKKTTVSNNDFNAGENDTEVVQFKPQSIKIKARPGIPVEFTMFYKPALDYPLDLYYLMDYSETMMDHATTLKEQGAMIYKELRRITNNVRLGVGSFIEKPALPFADVFEHLSYAFKNHLSLTENITLFEKSLEGQPFGSNYDDPESGFDALMQAMVCENIGWRENSRRIIVLSTDSTYHSAGDGKFVGAALPNDKKCHLDNNIYGEMALKFDYPTVGQINNIATKNNFKIIFAVTNKVKQDYIALEKKIHGAKYVPLKRGSHIVDMIRNQYLELIRTVTLDVYNIPSFMELSLKPNCEKSGNCIVQNKQYLEINGTLTIRSCPSNEKTHNFNIGPLSLNEKLNLEVEVECECECEKVGEREENSELCSGNGSYQCGFCNCYKNRSGDKCQCVGDSIDTGDEDKCRANANDTFPCSMFGTCRCGKCECQKGFSGDFCEFNDNACLSPGGLKCAGHGNCTFGRCTCEPHWTGEGCECPDNNCMAPYSQENCSGNGECICGECKCKPMANNKFCSGKFCDDCEEIAAKRCKELEDYAYCNYNKNKTVCDETLNHTDTEVILVDRKELYSPDWYVANVRCTKVLEDGRVLIFKYHYPNSTISSTLLLIIQNELDMPPVADIFIAAVSVLGSVLLIGLITVITWKVLIDMYDRREYEKFIKSSVADEYNIENDVYSSPIVTYTNPMRNAGNSQDNDKKD